MTPLVLFDHEMFALQRFGGITRVFIELMRRLARREDLAIAWHRGYHIDGYDVSDFSHRLAGYRAESATNLPTGALADGVANLASLGDFSRTLDRPVDILHMTYFDPRIPNAVAHRKLAVTVHDMIPELYFGDLQRFAALLAGRAELVHRADIIFVNSEQTRSDLLDFFPGVKGTVVLTPWASSLGSITPAELPAQVAGLSKRFLLYVGTRSKYKNFQVLMDAFAKNPSLRETYSVVVFGGSGDFLEHEECFFNEHGLAGTFHYVAGGDDVLRALYRSAAALVYTSRYEGFGLPPLEAMENGCPVVCCRTSSLPEVVGESALFFDPDESGELAMRLLALACDASLDAELRAAGPKRAGQFSWERTIELTVAAYKQVLVT